MSRVRDFQIEEFQRKAGIKPATGKALEVLQRMQEAALRVICAVELEASGIRDGDGCWSGACGLEVIDHLPALLSKYEEECKRQRGELEENPKADRAGDAHEGDTSVF